MGLVLCAKCVRHVRHGSACCPFCGAIAVATTGTVMRRMSRSALLGVVVATASCHATGSAPDAGTQTVQTVVYGGPPPVVTTEAAMPPHDGGVD